MAVIGTNLLKRRLFATEDDRYRLYIVPILDMASQLVPGRAAIDVRLGTEFILTRRVHFSHIAPFEEGKSKEKLAAEFAQYQEKIRVGFGRPFVLHPQQYAIGGTLEYFRLPIDLAGYVIGRSSWARVGLVIAMATVVHPGYTGVISLELQNLGDAPIALVAGARIGQMVFHKVYGNNDATFRSLHGGSKYIAAIAPGFSRIYEDSERLKIQALGKEFRNASNLIN